MSSGSGDVVPDPAIDAAVKLHQAGKIERAAKAYRQILEGNPNHANALHLLGLTELQLGHFEDAVKLIQRAISLQPNTGAFHVNLAAGLRAMHRVDDAIAEAEKAILLDPKLTAQGYHIAALAFLDGGQPDDAIDCWIKGLTAQPGYIEAHLALARVMDSLGLHFQSVTQQMEAETGARQAVEREPESAAARMLLGRALELGGRIDEAAIEYRAATRLLPHDAEVFHALGRALRLQGHAEEALTVLRFALRMNPKLADAHAELATLLLSQGKVADAVDSFRAAQKLIPANPEYRARLANALAHGGEVEQAIEEVRGIIRQRSGVAPATRSLLLRMLLLDARVTPQELFRAHLEWDRITGASMRLAKERYTKWEQRIVAGDDPDAAVHAANKDPDRPLRIAFVSPHFRRGALAKVLIPLLDRFDRKHFAVGLYADNAMKDDVTEQFKKISDGWREMAAFSDTQLARRIRADAIDILIDLTGHGEGNRMICFAQQPAPVQITQIGYPFTTGLAAIHYRISDDVADPPGEASDELNVEKLIRLPRPAICYRPWETTPPRIETRSASEPITFGCVGEAAHCSPQAVQTWAKLIARVADARLLVMSSTRDVEATRARLTRLGVPSFRLTVLPPEDGTRYLDLFNTIDIVLDTFPFSGGTTAGDALWMGKPIVTLASDTMPASRGAAVFLRSVGLDDLIATTPDQYVDIAAALASDRERLGRLAETLRATLARSPVCDAAACAAAMMAFYRDAWREWCAQP